MSNNLTKIMPQKNILSPEQENQFKSKFIKALRAKDEFMALSEETRILLINHSVYLLQNPEVCDLTTEEIVKGTLNLITALESQDYNNSSADPSKEFDFYAHKNQCLDIYKKAIDDERNSKNLNLINAAIFAIKKAAQLPLVITSKYYPGVVTIYCEYMSEQYSHFPTTLQPAGINDFGFQVCHFISSKNSQEERTLLKNILDNLSASVESINNNEKVKTKLKVLHSELSIATDTYLSGKLDSEITSEDEKKVFNSKCFQIIEKTKFQLRKELGWIDFLNNLLMSLIDALIATSNVLLGTSFNFFPLVKAPFVADMEELEQNYKL